MTQVAKAIPATAVPTATLRDRWAVTIPIPATPAGGRRQAFATRVASALRAVVGRRRARTGRVIAAITKAAVASAKVAITNGSACNPGDGSAMAARPIGVHRDEINTMAAAMMPRAQPDRRGAERRRARRSATCACPAR